MSNRIHYSLSTREQQVASTKVMLIFCGYFIQYMSKYGINDNHQKNESCFCLLRFYMQFCMKVRNKLDCTDKSDVSLTSMYVQLFYTYGYIRIHTMYVSLCFCSYPFSLLNHLSFYLIGLTHSLYFSNIRWVGGIRLKTLSKHSTLEQEQ